MVYFILEKISDQMDFFLPEKLEFSRHEEWPMRQSESVIGLKWSRWGQETA